MSREEPLPQRTIVLAETQHRRLKQELLRITDELQTTIYLKQLVQAALLWFQSLPAEDQLQRVAAGITASATSATTAMIRSQAVSTDVKDSTDSTDSTNDAVAHAPGENSARRVSGARKQRIKTVQLPVAEVDQLERLAAHLEATLRQQGVAQRNVPMRTVVAVALDLYLQQPEAVRTQCVERVR